MLNYIDIEQIDEEEEDLDERVVERAIVANIKKFILTVGSDFTFVGNQYYNKPMGVATYRTSEEMPEKLRRSMPDIEELKKLL